MKPIIGDLFTYDYITFYRVTRPDCLGAIESPQAIHVPEGDWRQAVQTYREINKVQVWEVNRALWQLPDLPGACKRIFL